MSQPPDQATSDPDQLVGLLIAVLGRIRDLLDRQAEAMQLPPRHAMALLHLNGPTSMGELASCLRCDASNVTGLADRLEVAGLVTRRPSPGDRRVKWLVLTDRGRGLRDQLRAQLFAADCAVAVLDEPQRQHLAGLLAQMLAGSGEAPTII